MKTYNPACVIVRFGGEQCVSFFSFEERVRRAYDLFVGERATYETAHALESKLSSIAAAAWTNGELENVRAPTAFVRLLRNPRGYGYSTSIYWTERPIVRDL